MGTNLSDETRDIRDSGFSDQRLPAAFIPQVQDGAAALVLVAVTLLVDLSGGVGRVALHHGVEILQALELVVARLLPVNPETKPKLTLAS